MDKNPLYGDTLAGKDRFPVYCMQFFAACSNFYNYSYIYPDAFCGRLWFYQYILFVE
jgi:hypothetical protein